MKKLTYYNCMMDKLDTLRYIEKKFPGYTLYWYKERKEKDECVPIRLRDLYRKSLYNLVIGSDEFYGPMFTLKGYVNVKTNLVVYDLWDFIEWE